MTSFLAKADRILDRAKTSLGEDILYTHGDGSSATIRGIWNNEYQIVDPDTEALVTSNNPHVGVILKDLLIAPANGDIVEFQSKQYKVIDIQEDGQGAAQLFLYKI